MNKRIWVRNTRNFLLVSAVLCAALVSFAAASRAQANQAPVPDPAKQPSPRTEAEMANVMMLDPTVEGFVLPSDQYDLDADDPNLIPESTGETMEHQVVVMYTTDYSE